MPKECVKEKAKLEIYICVKNGYMTFKVRSDKLLLQLRRLLGSLNPLWAGLAKFCLARWGLQGSGEAWVCVGVAGKAPCHPVGHFSLSWNFCLSCLRFRLRSAYSQFPVISIQHSITNVLLESNIETLIFLFCTTHCSKQASWQNSPGDRAERCYVWMPAHPSVPLYYGRCLSAACLDFLGGSNESESPDAFLVQSFTGTCLMWCLPCSYHRHGGPNWCNLFLMYAFHAFKKAPGWFTTGWAPKWVL